MGRDRRLHRVLLASVACCLLRAVLPSSLGFLAARSVSSIRGGTVAGTDISLRPLAVEAAGSRRDAATSGAVTSGFLLALAGSVLAGVRRRRAGKSSLGSASDRNVVSLAAARKPILRLGTRASPLALAQAYETKRRLAEAFPELVPDDAVEIKTFSTEGDQRLDIPLATIGGKGLFTRELDVALINKEVDFCVHSTKDVPTELVPGTELCTMFPREDSRDALISPSGITRIEDFPPGSVIGTASLRRQAQIYAKNPNVKCVNFRGNVQTRLRKLASGEVAATLLAYAGLKRMSMEEHATCVLDWDQMLPAIAQGAISIQCASDDDRTLKYLRPLSHPETFQAVTCERAFLAVLDGNCKTPIAGQAKVIDGELHFQGLVSSPDGQTIFRVERAGRPDDAAQIGEDAGKEIRERAGEQFFEEMQEYVQEVAAANSKPVRPSS